MDSVPDLGSQYSKSFERYVNKFLVASKKIIKDYQQPLESFRNSTDGKNRHELKRTFSQSSMASQGNLSDEESKEDSNQCFTIQWNKIRAANEFELQTGVKTVFDPDGDGFEFGYQEALTLMVRINLFKLLRREVITYNFRFFDWAVEELEQQFQSPAVLERAGLPPTWKVKDHDKQLIKWFSRYGLPILSKIKNNSEYGFEGISISKNKLLNRISVLATFFKDNLTKFKNHLRKNQNRPALAGDHVYNTKIDPSKNISSIKVETDSEGHIVYPIVVTSTLKILNLGSIDSDRPTFHSSRNIYPIGYKAVRTSLSMFHRDTKCDYICEILDNGTGPLYKVTPSDDPENPIYHSASSGAWIEICQKINSVNEQNRQKVTVSGPDRFGIAEPQVTQLIASMPGARKCHKFVPPNGWPEGSGGGNDESY